MSLPTKAITYLNCTSFDTCTYGNNKGWRILMYSSSTMVFIMSILRVTVIRLRETPKYLLGEGKDEQLVAQFHELAGKYNRPCTITVEELAACGVVRSAHVGQGRQIFGLTVHFSFSEFLLHIRGLFATKKIGLSTSLIWFSWTLIGLFFPE